MLEKIKKWNLWYSGVAGISAWLVLLAGGAASTACSIFWYEPDCPKELLE